MSAPGCGNESLTGGHLDFSHFFPQEVNWMCRGSQALSLSDLGSGAARKRSQAEDGLARLSAKDEKDDDNLGHTHNKQSSLTLSELGSTSLVTASCHGW